MRSSRKFGARMLWTIVASAFALLVGTGLLAQEDASPISISSDRLSLSEAIATALQSNPDIQIAEAKVRAASAELNRVRLEVVREITAAYAEVRFQRQAKESLTKLSDREWLLFENEGAPGAGAIAAHDALEEAESALAEAEAKLPYLLGTGASPLEPSPPAPAVPGGVRPVPSTEREPSARMQEVLEVLDSRRVRFAFEETSLADVLEATKSVAGLSFVVSYHVDAADEIVSLEMDAPLRHFLIALADQNDEICFVVRDYGILVTTVEHALRLGGPTIPSDVGGRAAEE